MNIFVKKSETLKTLRRSVERFPLTIAYSIVWALAALGETMDKVRPFNFASLTRVLGLGTIISLLIGVFIENLEEKDRKKAYLLYLVEGISLYFLYGYLLDRGSLMVEEKYIALVLISLIGLGFIGRLLKPSNYNFYLRDIIRGGLIGFLNSIVLLLGLYFIIFSLTSLFNIRMDKHIYEYLYNIIFTVFFTLVFTSNFPLGQKDYGQDKMSQVSEKLYSYILIPLLVIYSLILYAFFIKISLTKNWPRGLVAHLVLWYSLVGLGVMFFTEGSKHRMIVNFRRYYPLMNLPNLIIMFYAIYLRVGQYGFTNQRYYVLLAGLWVFLMDLFYIFNKKDRNIVLPLSLVFIITLSTFGPLSSFNTSLRSQDRRLEEILQANKLLENGRLVKAESLSLETKEEILDIATYLDGYYDLDQIQSLRGTSLEELEGILSIKSLEPGLGIDATRLNISYKYSGGPGKITGYDYLYRPDFWFSESTQLGDLSLELLDDFNLSLKLGQETKEFDLASLISKKYDLEKLDPKLPIEVELDIGGQTILLRLDHLAGYLTKSQELGTKPQLSLDRIEGYILIKATD